MKNRYVIISKYDVNNEFINRFVEPFNSTVLVVETELEDLEEGETIRLKVLEMTEEEYEVLAEREGY